MDQSRRDMYAKVVICPVATRHEMSQNLAKSLPDPRGGGGAVDGRAKRERRRRAAIFGASGLGHAALLILVFASASGNVVSSGAMGGGPTGPIFAVTLVRPASEATAEADFQASPLIARLQVTQADDALHVAPKQGGDGRFRALAERLTIPTEASAGEQQALQSREAGAVIPSRARADPAARGRERDAADASGEGASASTGGLWGAIAPCWRDLGSSSRVPVVLEVALDGRGQLRSPPRILRADDAKLNDPRLQAEERALAALAACMPRNDVRLGGRTYRLEFPARPNG